MKRHRRISRSRPLFNQLNRFHLALAFICLMLLRIVIGYHFYKEGTNKLKAGNFSSKGFLSAAKGPFAPYFKGMLDDPDGMKKLCVKQVEGDDGSTVYVVDPEFTFAIWNEFLDETHDYYGFGSLELEEELKQRRADLAEKIEKAREEKNTSVDTSLLEAERKKFETDILTIRNQTQRAQEIYEDHIDQLNDWIAANELELVSHFSTVDRLDGFDRDGKNKKEASVYVDSLREQVESIQWDRSKKLAGWTSDVTGVWDSLESQINALATDDQIGERPTYEMHRHFDQENSMVKVIDRVIPWFDTVIGVLLIIGLFSRLASLAAAGFLFSVIMTQPPWIPGTAPTYFYCIEFAALLVIFATCAGRMGGLDYFFSPIAAPNTQLDLEGQA